MRYRSVWLLWSCTILLGSAQVISARPIEFVVAELPGAAVHNDSFIVQIDDADATRIAHARALADWIDSGAAPENSPGATIVVAHIAPGSDGVNRNVRAANEPLWSWHIDEPVDFADSTIEILDGWPTFVEQDVPGWIANTNSYIGFWTYTIVDELPAVPEPVAGMLFFVGAGMLGRRVRATHPTSSAPDRTA